MKQYFRTKIKISIICFLIIMGLVLRLGMPIIALNALINVLGFGSQNSDILIDARDLDDRYYNLISFPLFGNNYGYSRGGSTSSEENYLNYKEHISDRHIFKDMINHSSEVAAVRLTEKGVFSADEWFYPDSNMTVISFLRFFLSACSCGIGKTGSDRQVIEYIEKTNLIENGVTLDYNALLNNEVLAYILGRAAISPENSNQYMLLIDDYNDITPSFAEEALNTIALGITEINDFTFNPKNIATKNTVADCLYRLINAGARVIPMYNLGNYYNRETNEYVIKSSYKTNESGTQFGFFTNYNKQSSAFKNFGKLPMDRNEFHKWSNIETEKGVYKMPAFKNEQISHMTGNTVISCVDISANKNWNSQFEKSNIPEFYEQDITNPETRTAAKAFLYAFVQKMLTEIGGNIILAIDYELDWQQAIYNNEAGWNRANLFSQWFTEACATARTAASDMGASNRLQLIVIYNNITDTHLRGVSENQWMLDMANVVDYIGIDTYNFYEDKTDPSYTIQNIRYLMNNYSLGKPVIVVENGISVLRDQTVIDAVTGLTQDKLAEKYYENLFREFRFCLEKGEFLNANLYGFLVWSYFDTNDTSEKVMGIAEKNGTLRDSGKAIENGISLMYKQRQFNPSYLVNTERVTSSASIKVKNGSEYEKLTVVKCGVSKGSGAQLNVKLNSSANIFIVVNGLERYDCNKCSTSHKIDIENLRTGTNVIDIYFGAEQMPFELNVTEVLLSEIKQGDCNSDGNVDIKDLVRLKKFIAGIQAYTNTSALDIDSSGDINNDDLKLLRRKILHS